MSPFKYTARYIMENGEYCYIGGGDSITKAIECAIWIIKVDGLDDAKEILIFHGEEQVAWVKVE